MKILFLTHRFPYPPDRGDRIRSFNFIKHLSARHEIHLMSVCFGKTPGDEDRNALEKFSSTVEVFPINYRGNMIKSIPFLLSDIPLTTLLFQSEDMKKRLKERLERERFDLIYIYSSSMAPYVMGVRDAAKIMDFIDVDSEKWNEYAFLSRAGLLKKWVYKREARCLRKFELAVERRCQASVFASENEAAIFRRFAPYSNVFAIGNGVGTDFYLPERSPAEKERIVFTGMMDYYPNIDAVQWFAGEVLPLVARKRPEAEFLVVGNNPPAAVRRLARGPSRVTVTGHVPDVKEYLSSARVAVVPLRIARGIQNKVLEAMAAGVPVVATPAAAKGVDAKPGVDFLVAGGAEEFSSHVIRLLEDDRLRTQMAASAIGRVRERYNWEGKAVELESLMARAVEEKTRRDGNGAPADVSFIIPALNVEAYLPRCLEAIRRQEAGADFFFEVIVVDNGSADRTVEIAREHGARIYSAPGETVAALRNIGAARARGRFLAYVDADCIIGEGWLANALRHFSNPEVGGVGAATGIEDGKNSWVERTWLLQRRNGTETGVRPVSWLPTENLVIRKTAFEAAGGFNESLITCEDVDLCYRLSRQCKSKILSDPAMRSVHLGEARTLRQFYRKEKWRGMGNFQGLLSHGIIRDEIPSLLLPLYFLIAFSLFVFSAVWGLAHGETGLLPASALLIACPVLLLAFRASVRGRSWRAFCPLCLLYFVYALARTAAILPGI